MLNQQVLKILSLLVLLSAAINSIEAKSCVELVPVENFERSWFAGLWSEHARSIGQKNSEACIKYLFLVDNDENDDTCAMVGVCVDDRDNSQYMILKNGTLNVNGEGEGLSDQKHTIIDTDYNNWAVIFACDEAAESLLIWVITRQTEPSFDTLVRISDVLNKYDIKNDDLDFTRRDNCPDDWSNAVIKEIDFPYKKIKKELRRNGLI